jgi:DNA-directed RNA polymerase subunit beta
MVEVKRRDRVSRSENLRYRKDFSKIKSIIEIPNLLATQQESFERFLQLDVLPDQREDVGVQAVFKSVFPITNYNKTAKLEFVSYELGSWECSCGRLKGMANRYSWSCSCGKYQGLCNIAELPEKERTCPHCGSAVAYTTCNHCEKRVSLKLKYDVRECRERGMSYSLPLKVLLNLYVYEKDPDSDKPHLRDIREQEVYLGELPIMINIVEDEEGRLRVGDRGIFIINGTERVIVSQMHRSPGVFFKHDGGKSHISGKILYNARIIPYRGSWIEFEFDINDILYVRIDRKRKLPATVLLRALGYPFDQDILKMFYTTETLRKTDEGFIRDVGPHMIGERALMDIVHPETGKVLIKEDARFTRGSIKKLHRAGVTQILLTPEKLVGKIVVDDLIDPETGEVLVECNQEITHELADKIFRSSIPELEVVFLETSQIGSSLHETILKDRLGETANPVHEAQVEIYKRLRPGDPLTVESAANLFERLFFDPKYYDLSKVGRLKLNKKLGLDHSIDQRTVTREDIVETVRYLFRLKNGRGSVDDIDHLGNRRVRSVGELLRNQFRLGLVRMERAIKERMSIQDLATAMPHDLINAKPVTAALSEFFGSSQLSQFMDQTNPLAELTHKRRLSALGPGGLSRDRAGFEVRDVHTTHYGRICPIETPEGPNVGLIVSLSTYARVNEYGFIETPYRRVVNGVVQNEIDYLTALDEDQTVPELGRGYIIAQANSPIDPKTGKLLGERISARSGGDFVMAAPEDVDYMDVSPRQLVSVSTSLIPFLENDDANRALMGSNMQRQAVPLLRSEAPLVGTGMEYIAARDSGVVVLARRSGVVESVSADRIIIRADVKDDGDPLRAEPNIDIYNLIKFQRSNQNTCVNQKPIVRVGQRVEANEVIADGPATDMGELALGRNILVAFMPWHGYNFEDAIIVSEKVVKEDMFTSIHIENFDTEARDTKLGKEEITRDIPNVAEEQLRNLDESGIVYIGAEVKAGDVLVGKITPKGETQLTPEEKLLRAIFGEKAGDVRDASLTVPPGIEGTVIDVKVFSRKGIEKDERHRAIEETQIAKMRKDFEDEAAIIRREGRAKARRLLVGAVLQQDLVDQESGDVLLTAGTKLDEEAVEKIPDGMLGELEVEDTGIQQNLEQVLRKSEELIEIQRKMLGERIERLLKGDELPPGVIKLVRVSLAVKRKLSVGDKMAGRHGNKGVISTIVPEEDMPFLPDGTPVEIILNPLGVPSRMNVGQIKETHLGWAAHKLGLHMATPVFDGASEDDIRAALAEAGLPETGKTTLYDGRTGEPFDQDVTVGYIYMMKLAHLVDDKIHARSIGPYSLVTQQPLGGRAQFGGQRFGEMEVWALEAYGAAYTLQELLTVKSDDVLGRTRVYQSILKNEPMQEPGLPESFNVLVKELQSLALDIELLDSSKLENAE